MANTLGIDFGIDAAEFAADLSSILVWGAQTVTGTRSAWVRDLDPDESGILNFETCEWLAAASVFASSILPPNNTDVTVDGTKVHILNREENEDDTVVRFQLRRKVIVA